MYVCGPTVYAPAHVGHGRTYLYFDMVRRFFADEGVPVRHLMNITDVEDKIDQRARELRITPLALARREERRFFKDLGRLNVLPPTYAPRASDFVGSMVRYARRLERTGRVQPLGDGWFFRPRKRRGHTNFAVARDLDRHMVQESPEASGPSLDPRDFLVWRRQDPPRLSFQSPWGPGVPGWHLECYAMAARYLGVPVDLQGGGQDLIFPHHFAQNEVALTLLGHPFARGFLHTGFVLRNGTKMSKSIGNLVDLADAVDEFGASAVRWYLLGAPRSTSIDWQPYGVARARRTLDEVMSTVRALLEPGVGQVAATELEGLADSMKNAIGTDLGTDRAFQRLDGWSRRTAGRSQPHLRRGERPRARRAIARIERLTGLALQPPRKAR
jgi:cysteinyl-tRNA synthetase